MNIATCVLNWKRPSRLRRIVDALKKQTVEPKVWVWNNNPDHVDKDFGAHNRIDSTTNLQCWPRWVIMSMFEVDTIFTWDDDLIPTEPDVLERAYNRLSDLPDDGIVGTHGVKLDGNYWDSEHIHNPSNEHNVDIVKGRFMMMRKSVIESVEMRPSWTTDDIKISSVSDNKILIGGLGTDTKNLEEDEVGLWRKDWQKDRRVKATKKFFG